MVRLQLTINFKEVITLTKLKTQPFNQILPVPVIARPENDYSIRQGANLRSNLTECVSRHGRCSNKAARCGWCFFHQPHE